jgi:hypothetical protein
MHPGYRKPGVNPRNFSELKRSSQPNESVEAIAAHDEIEPKTAPAAFEAGNHWTLRSDSYRLVGLRSCLTIWLDAMK